MINQEPKHISEFKKGQIITRVEPAYMNEIYDDLLRKSLPDKTSADRSGMEGAFEYLGVVNNMIILKCARTDSSFKKGELCTYFSYDIFQNGWALWVDPQTLIHENEPKNAIKDLTNKLLEDNFFN